MILNDDRINERRVRAVLNEDEIRTILVNHVADLAGFEQGIRTKTQVFIRQKDTSTGFKDEAEIILVNDMTNTPMAG